MCSSTRPRNEIILCGFLGASQIRFGLHTPAIISRKSGTHCAAEMPYQRAPNRTGTVAHELCARALRTVIAHELCAEPLRIFSLHYHPYPIVVRPMRRSSPGPHRRGDPVLHQTGGPVLHQRGGQCSTRLGVRCCTRGGQNGGSDPPRLRTSCGTDPLMQCASRGPLPPSLRGGRSRHNNPCGKARIAER